MGSLVRHGLFASLALNVLLGVMFWKATAQTPPPAATEAAASAMSNELFPFYTKALDSCRDTAYVLQGVYCNGLDSNSCTEKFDKAVHAVGGDVLSRYVALKHESEIGKTRAQVAPAPAGSRQEYHP
ncbi:hypothetical protein QU487_06535 [Crenobacter sp. SG2305]|uniref:hypothetical protein n=1 Tax=Crenobacter oryzisoli TaxID=3056844 RepID=UPI0025AB0445|nr:hypothetical protein [Crenobacter sp. SG2305]MDN0082410.1 hypothetical protein [Crenobacter sp. SG2305]